MSYLSADNVVRSEMFGGRVCVLLLFQSTKSLIAQNNFRCSMNATISLKTYDGGPYLLLMHPDPTLEGRLRYAIYEGRTRLGTVAAAGRSSSLHHEVLSSVCDSSTKGDDRLTTS